MLVVITGIPGAGKTTIATKALKELKQESGVEYEIITYGSVMFEIAKERGLVKHRDEMRKLKPEIQREIQLEAAMRIYKMSREKNILLDTHCTISTPKGYLPGLPEYILKELKPHSLIIIESKPEEIIERRVSDKSRERDSESMERIELHQEINRYFAAAYSAISGCTIKIIQNHQGRIAEAVEELKKVLS